jgi:hypothetical protein
MIAALAFVLSLATRFKPGQGKPAIRAAGRPEAFPMIGVNFVER